MISCTYGCLRNVINLGNSIIGVSILAMPYCFQKCGIILSLLLIILSGILVRIACYLLLKGAVMARRRNFECLAFHALGSSGKLAVEIGVIGFLIGVCIAFFVVIGDLGPPLASQYFMIENTSNLRAEVLIFLGVFVALPLGLLRKVDSLTSLSFLSIAFYICLILKIFGEASSKLVAKDWLYEVNWWKSEGFLPCLPIFSMALSCQTQLFEFFDTLSEPSIKRMTSVVSGAVYLCSSVYISVGLFGYIACHDKTITGNILVNMTPSLITEFIKFGFIVTVVISFPLCLFPCRTSLHSLLFKQGLGHHDMAVNFIPDYRFRVLTISLVVITVGISIMLPNIEFVLSIVGSTIGTAICLIFPAVIFIHDTNKNTTEKRLAQSVLCVGMFILVACTYTTLREGSESHPQPIIVKEPLIIPHPLAVQHFSSALDRTASPLPMTPGKEKVQNMKSDIVLYTPVSKKSNSVNGAKDDNEKRHEPPEPQAPDIKVEKNDHNADIDPQALQKEDKEIQKESINNGILPVKAQDVALKEKQEQLLRQLQEQQKEQKIILEQQKQVLKELKMHKEIHDEAIREKNIKEAPDEENISVEKKKLPQNYVRDVPNVPSESALKIVASAMKNEQYHLSLAVKNIQPNVHQNLHSILPEKQSPSKNQDSGNQFSASININVIPEIIISQNTKSPVAVKRESILDTKLNIASQNNVAIKSMKYHNSVKNPNNSIVKTHNFSKSSERNVPLAKNFEAHAETKYNVNNSPLKEIETVQNLRNEIESQNAALNNHSNTNLQNNELLHVGNEKPEMK